MAMPFSLLKIVNCMLTVSNIAWNDGADLEFIRMISQFEFDGLDIAPTKIWPNWNIPSDNGLEFRSVLDSFGLSVIGMQSLFFGAGPLNLFCTENSEWQAFINHFHRLSLIAKATGATRLVFGAPSNRDPRGLEGTQLQELALTRLEIIGDIMLQEGLILCMEPVPCSAGGKFLCTTEEAARFLSILNHPGILLNLDSAVLFIEKADINSTIKQYSHLIAHAHASEPALGNFNEPQVNHMMVSAALKEANYSGAIAIEMNANPNRQRENLIQAMNFVKAVYE